MARIEAIITCSDHPIIHCNHLSDTRPSGAGSCAVGLVARAQTCFAAALASRFSIQSSARRSAAHRSQSAIDSSDGWLSCPWNRRSCSVANRSWLLQLPQSIADTTHVVTGVRPLGAAEGLVIDQSFEASPARSNCRRPNSSGKYRPAPPAAIVSNNLILYCILHSCISVRTRIINPPFHESQSCD